MKSLSRLFSAVVLGSLVSAPCLGFGTGSHYDLTRTVLTEHDFSETPIKIAQVENWLTDYYSNSPTYDHDRREVLEKLHFDNLFDEDQVRSYWSTLLRNLRSSTQKAARDEDQMAMLVTLGIGLHTVQDFYSHSNWVELHPRRENEPFRVDTYLDSLRSSPLALMKKLHTGKFPEDRTSGPGADPIPANADIHGSYDIGLNKDSPQRPGWADAFVYAYVASHELIGAMEKWAEEVRPGFWRSVREYSVGQQEKKLNADVLAARNISMWIDSKGQDGNWKGKGSGSIRFFSAFSSKWVAADTSVFVRAVRDGTIQDDLAAGLYSGKTAGEMPAVDRYSLKRAAVIIAMTFVSESKDDKWLQRRLSGTGGSDFYSRIVAGGQEFFGRTMQKARESIDPWYEICIVDPQTSVIPITISVWDEDNIDPREDEHVDINPAPGLFDLNIEFRMADNSLTGDVNGTFGAREKTFLSVGSKPEKRRALIRGYITQRPIQ